MENFTEKLTDMEELGDALRCDRRYRETWHKDEEFAERDRLINEFGIMIIGCFTVPKLKIPEGVKAVLVRIGDPTEILPDIDTDQYITVREFRFRDTGGPTGIDVMTAESLARFIKKMPDHDLFVVHCFAGVARSAAVAMFYGDVRGKPEAVDIISECGLYEPNERVYNFLTAAFGTGYCF